MRRIFTISMASDEKENVEVKEIQESSEEKMVIHMRIAAHQLLSKLLRPSFLGKDWKSLADLMGFTYEEILNLECDIDPVESVVRQWERKPDATINKLISYLEELGREDVIEDLQPFVVETPLPTEHKKRALERHQQRPAENRLSPELESLTLSDEIYDGFISYAAEDRSFAHEIMTKLEAHPYNRKICIDYRDYVPGSCRLDQTAKIIEDRCKRIVAILTPNFKNSPDAGFQVQIALSLSPDTSKRRVIPVVYERCETSDIPRILRHISWLDYTCKMGREYFWLNLAKALGYSEPPTPKTASPLLTKKKGISK